MYAGPTTTVAGGDRRRTLEELARATRAWVAELSLKDARERAGRELAGIRAGESDPLDRRRDDCEAPTVAEGLDRFFGQFAVERTRLGRLSPRTLQTYLRRSCTSGQPSVRGASLT